MQIGCAFHHHAALFDLDHAEAERPLAAGPVVAIHHGAELFDAGEMDADFCEAERRWPSMTADPTQTMISGDPPIVGIRLRCRGFQDQGSPY